MGDFGRSCVYKGIATTHDGGFGWFLTLYVEVQMTVCFSGQPLVQSRRPPQHRNLPSSHLTIEKCMFMQESVPHPPSFCAFDKLLHLHRCSFRKTILVFKHKTFSRHAQSSFARYPELRMVYHELMWNPSSIMQSSCFTFLHHLLPPERAALCESGLATGGLAQDRRAACADDDCLCVREDGGDCEAAGALDVHEE